MLSVAVHGYGSYPDKIEDRSPTKLKTAGLDVSQFVLGEQRRSRTNSRCLRFVCERSLKATLQPPPTPHPPPSLSGGLGRKGGSVTPLRELHDCIGGWLCTTRTGTVQQTVGERVTHKGGKEQEARSNQETAKRRFQTLEVRKRLYSVIVEFGYLY